MKDKIIEILKEHLFVNWKDFKASVGGIEKAATAIETEQEKQAQQRFYEAVMYLNKSKCKAVTSDTVSQLHKALKIASGLKT